MGFRRMLGVGIATAALALLASCGGGGSSVDSGAGTLKLSLTDAPACGYDQVNVTIQKIRINQSSSAADTDPGWSEMPLNPALRVNLLTLNNGVLATLGQIPLQAGHYSQLRLVLAPNTNADPLANSVVPTGGPEVPLTTPSGTQSGVKMNADITIAPDQLADFVLDFNACKSVVTAGNSGKYLLKPVVAVTPNYISAAGGYVDASLANGNTSVSLQQGGVVVKATSPDSNGHFLLQPVAPGTYDLVITAPGRTTDVITDVTVVASTVTLVNAATSPLTLPPSSTGTLAGTVTTAATPIDATVRALQTLTGGDRVEIADQFVDTVTGAYSETVPVNAVRVAPYLAPLGALNFSPDPSTAATYSLEASSGGVVKSAGPLTVTAGATTITNFSF